MKIGIISTFPPTQCGIASYASDFIKNLKRKYPALLIYQFELTYTFLKSNSKKIIIKNHHADNYLKASEIINSSDIDILDVQHEFKIFGKPDGENIEILLDNVKKPIATTLHTVHFKQPKNRERIFQKILYRSDLLFLFSEDAKRHIVKKYNAKESKIVVISHGVPTIPFCLPSKTFKGKYFSNDLIFISAGHMRETKGYHIALQALNNLKHKIKKFHYIIAGSNHPQNETAQVYRNKLIELVKNLGLKYEVTFINKYLPEKNLIELIQMADICLLPYTRQEQSSSGVLSLMITCGRPIVTTPFQFASSQISDKSGAIAKSFLPTDFKRAIEHLIERKNNWRKIMHYNHTLGKSWNWQNVATKYYWAYKKIKREHRIFRK